MAVLAEHRRNGLVKEGKIEVRDVDEVEFGVLALPITQDGIQTRKKACRIAPENGAPFQIIQLKALQDPMFGVRSQVSAQVRKIRSIQNSIDSRYVAQHAEHRIACSKGRIPIDATEHVSGGTSFLAAGDEPHLIDDCKTRGKVRDRASSMRGDV